jgi:hypothetical protein
MRKHPLESISTDDGRQILKSDEQPGNTCDSIRESVEPVSNIANRSAVHELKHPESKVSTDDGMQIDENDGQSENSPDSIRES